MAKTWRLLSSLVYHLDTWFLSWLFHAVGGSCLHSDEKIPEDVLYISFYTFSVHCSIICTLFNQQVISHQQPQNRDEPKAACKMWHAKFIAVPKLLFKFYIYDRRGSYKCGNEIYYRGIQRVGSSVDPSRIFNFEFNDILDGRPVMFSLRATAGTIQDCFVYGWLWSIGCEHKRTRMSSNNFTENKFHENYWYIISSFKVFGRLMATAILDQLSGVTIV